MFELIFEEGDISMILEPNKKDSIGGLFIGSILTI